MLILQKIKQRKTKSINTATESKKEKKNKKERRNIKKEKQNKYFRSRK